VPDLDDRVVAVTGASAGIGAATARALAGAGARLALLARRGDRLDALVDEVGADRALAVPGDVRSPEDNRRLVDVAVDRFGRLDGIVANAGLGVYGGILDQTEDQVREMVDVNVSGTVWSVRAAVPRLLEAGGGDLVIVASVAGLRGAGDEAVYAATKHAQVGLAGSLDRELRERGIAVTVICPGGVATEFAMGTGRTPDMPGLDDMLRPEDVAAAVVTVLGQPRSIRTLLWSMRSMKEAD
jgi:NADP-dependent 3-hydroxy acid dehydrogenase YdfG